MTNNFMLKETFIFNSDSQKEQKRNCLSFDQNLTYTHLPVDQRYVLSLLFKVIFLDHN